MSDEKADAIKKTIEDLAKKLDMVRAGAHKFYGQVESALHSTIDHFVGAVHPTQQRAYHEGMLALMRMAFESGFVFGCTEQMDLKMDEAIVAKQKAAQDKASARDAVRALGERIGFGHVMQLCNQLWRKVQPGNEHSIGPCAAFLVECPHARIGIDASKCEWCCGTGRVTKRVAEAFTREIF